MDFTNDHEEATTPHTCTRCGSCCRHFAYVRLTTDDVARLVAFTGHDADAFTHVSDEATGERFLQFQENGHCIFHRLQDGRYLCSVYEARSALCRGYPTSEAQHQTCRKARARTP